MDSLADLFNSETGIPFKDKVYKLRQPTANECGRYQRELEADARASVLYAPDLSEDQKRQQLTAIAAACAAKRFRYGGEVCVESLRTVEGVAKLISIICEDQGLTYELALEFCDLKLREIVASIKIAEAADDPKAQAAIPAMLSTLGLPLTFLSSGLSDSATPPSEAPPMSNTSETSASDRSSASTPPSNEPSPGTPS